MENKTNPESDSETLNKKQTDEITSDKIIEKHAYTAFLASFIPYPFLDLAMVTAIQIDMAEQLTLYYDKNFDKEKVKIFLSSIVSTGIGRNLGRLGASAVKVIPGIGTILGSAVSSLMAAASTYATGKIFVHYYEKNESIFEAPSFEIKELFEKYKEKGKQIVNQYKTKKEAESIYKSILEMHTLKEKGIISEEEFENMRKKAMEKISDF